MRACRRCGQDKPLADFCKDRSRKDGIHPNCRDCRNQYSRQGRAKNPKAHEARRQRWLASPENAEKQKAAEATWRAKNPGYSAEANRAWREAHPDARAAYYQANRESARERYLKRRAIKKAATVAPVDIERLWADSDGTCQLCGDPIDRSVKGPDPMAASIDHIVPLARGGKHEQANLQWAHLVCNKRKGARVPEHFYPARVAPSGGSDSNFGFVP